MIERWALISGLKGDLDTYELIQKDLKKTPGNITLFVLGDMIGPSKNCNALLNRLINPKNNELVSIINTTLLELDISASSVLSGYGKGDLPDWGGEHFRLLTKPQIALLGQSDFNSYDVGSSWWTLDKNLGIRHSQINSSFIGNADLRRYNTIIMPDGYRDLSDEEIKALNDWIKQGGTLIAHDNSSSIIASKSGLGSVTKIQYSLDKTIDFDIDLQ